MYNTRRLAAPARESVEMSTRFSNLKVGITTLFFFLHLPATEYVIMHLEDMDAIVKAIRVAPIDGTT